MLLFIYHRFDHKKILSSHTYWKPTRRPSLSCPGHCRHICPAKRLARCCRIENKSSKFSEAILTPGHIRSTIESTATTTTMTLVTQTRAKSTNVRSSVAARSTHIHAVAEPAGTKPKPVSSRHTAIVIVHPSKIMQPCVRACVRAFQQLAN